MFGFLPNRRKEKFYLEKILHYVLLLNRSRAQQIELLNTKTNEGDLHSIQNQPGEDVADAIGNQAIAILQTFSLAAGAPFVQVEFSPDIASANLQGVRLAHAVWQWAASLSWSNDPNAENCPAIHWGISWLELFFNFYVIPDFILPIKVDGRGKQARYLDYFCPECRILPDKVRSVGNQVLLFQSAIRTLEILTNMKIMPPGMRWGCRSLKRLPFLGKCAGIGTRPVMLQQHETMQKVQHYLESLKGAKCFRNDLPEQLVSPSVFVPADILELSPEVRLQNYGHLWRHG